ncbi:c-type cytochrome [Tropicimonas sp.]|uniref:c-type cytochrome n=1 Tax=Tropicimonas sp. TaxID=2067044 RepID=UPI003A84D95A
MKHVVGSVLVLGAALAGVGWFLSAPGHVDPGALDGIAADVARGETVFYAGGCASCHSAPGAEGDAKLVLSGGRRFASDFGTFLAPNISSDPDQGIGDWTALELADAMMKGTGPEGQHFYPAFPYTSYARMEVSDIVALHGFLATLPADATPSQPHEVGFPFSIRRAVGLWKLLFLRDGWVVDRDDLTDQQRLGRYLVEGPGHCGECHTPRNALGALRLDEWLSGAPNPAGRGRIPDITPGGLDWSERDIAEYLKSGFTPDYDSAGGEMVDVIENMSHLSDDDRLAIAAYLGIVPPT